MRGPQWRVSFALLAVIWGCSFWWVEEALEAFTPLQTSFARAAIGSVVLGAVVLATRTPLPLRAQWKSIAVVALLLNVGSVTLFALGQMQVTSVLAGVINATTPLWAIAVALLFYPDERPTLGLMVGLLTGLVGVLVMLGVWQSQPVGQWIGVAACLVATVCYGIALPYARRHLTGAGMPTLSLAAGQVALGAVFLLPLAAVDVARVGLTWPENPTAPILAVLALGALGSGVAYVLNLSVIRSAGSAGAASVTYVIPIVAALVGVVLLGEAVSWYEPLGAAIVLLGIFLSQGRLRPHPARSSAGRSRAKGGRGRRVPRRGLSRRGSAAHRGGGAGVA